jgi:LysR family transcriptional regulator, glycine cleavage system transcriptional activator
MARALPYKAIAAFHATAQLGSLAEAAVALGVSPSAISQQISYLERHLATTLFVRQNRKIKLTEAGERYFESVAAALDLMENATDRVRGYKESNTLSMRAAPSFATKWLLPRVASIIESFPKTGIRLDATNELTDFEREGVDLDIRYGAGDWPGLYLENIGQEAFVPLVSPSLASEGSLTVDDLRRFRLIHSVKSLVTWPQFFRAHNLDWIPPVAQTLRFDRSYMVVDAASRGLGIALESKFIAEVEIASGKLVCPVATATPFMVQSHWIACPAGHLRLSKVERFLSWLRTELGASPFLVPRSGMKDEPPTS